MKNIILVFLFIISASVIYSTDQWIYAGTSPSGTGKGYSGVSSPDKAGDFFYNPAAPAFVHGITFFGNSGFLSQDSIFNAGASIPLPNGVLTAAGHLLGSSTGSLSGFSIGFSKRIVSDFSFGFAGTVYNQTASNSADIAIGLDAGALFILKDLIPFEKGIGIKNDTLGLAVSGLGKPALVAGGDPVPGMGGRVGFSGTWMDFGGFQSILNLEAVGYGFPQLYFGSAGLTFIFAEHIGLKGGFLLGNGGLGSFDNGLAPYTLGASFSWQVGETPIEFYYSYNPHRFNGTNGANHFIGAEISFGAIDKNPPSVSLESGDEKTNFYYFSPNYDGFRDTASLYLEIKDESMISSWELNIYNNRWEMVRQIKGEEERDVSLNPAEFFKRLFARREPVTIPETFDWNGTSGYGNLVPEGKYYTVLTAIDEFKNAGSSVTNTLILDITPPSGNISVDDMLFSPNGDGNKDTVGFNLSLSANDNWRAEVRDQSGNMVKIWNWGTNAPSRLEWDGKDNNGKVLPDGTYDCLFYGDDSAGNRNILPVKGIGLSIRRYSAFLVLNKTDFSPTNNSGIRIQPLLSDTNEIEQLDYIIQATNGNILREWKTNILNLIVWDGKDASGMTVPDGNYFVSMKAAYRNGDMPQTQLYPVIVDSAPPAVSFSAEPRLFSPDGDGDNDTLYIHFQAQDLRGIKKWSIVLLDPDKKAFKKFSGEGNPAETIRWDGRSDNGELVESAQDYPVLLSAEDQLGNLVSNVPAGQVHVDVLVERTDRGLKIRINNIEFEFGKADLKGVSNPILDRVTEILAKYGNYRAEIQGHTDNIGSEQKNKELSKQRSLAVYNYLAKKGIIKERMSTVGFGYQYPAADNSTEEGRRKNRRVEFILIKPEKK